ncbi:TRAP transporter small permease [Hominifimenecus sp. rT4P-3]|uniref:TRAP transporter small permease n=1 Tax=Hominifimenecus sp. rT4P-3 TaxID=3242979 RepID=UPI003DA33086
MKKTIRWLDEHFEEMLMVILLAVITCVIMLQVIMRYFFRSAMAWPEELSRYCFVWSGLLSASYCVRKNNAINLDILTSILPKGIATVLDYLAKFLLLGTYGFFFYQSIFLVQATVASKTLSTALRLPLQYVYASCLVGFGLGTIRQVQNIILTIKHGPEAKKNRGELETEEEVG